MRIMAKAQVVRKERQELKLDLGWKQLPKETTGCKNIALKEFFNYGNSDMYFMRLNVISD